MGKTQIQYADEVSNPLQAKDLETGKMGTHCEKPDPEGTCKGCWAEVLNTRGGPDNKRFGTGLTYDKANRDRIEWHRHEKEMRRLANLNRRKPESVKFPGNPLVVFTNDTYDLFQPSITDEHRDWVFDNYDGFTDLNLLVQTTYVSRMRGYLVSRYPNGMPSQYIVGMSAGTQKFLDDNYDHLRAVKAQRRYVICEPTLEDLDFSVIFGLYRTEESRYTPTNPYALKVGSRWEGSPDWIICGGESGPQARPMPYWVPGKLLYQCQEAGAAFLFKQHGEWVSEMHDEAKPGRQPTSDQFVKLTDGGSDYEGLYMCRVGKKKAGRLLDGRTWDEFPELSR